MRWIVLCQFSKLLIPFAFLILVNSTLSANDHPNVIVILTDDQGWGDLSLHGNPNLSTPKIDELACQGAQVEHFYVCPVCSPTRAEFLTGRYHTRLGVYSTSAGGERLNADEQTIADVSKPPDMQQPHTASGTTECSIRITPTHVASMTSVVSAAVTGGTTFRRCLNTTARSCKEMDFWSTI